MNHWCYTYGTKVTGVTEVGTWLADKLRRRFAAL